jgi:hypothetical protein
VHDGENLGCPLHLVDDDHGIVPMSCDELSEALRACLVTPLGSGIEEIDPAGLRMILVQPRRLSGPARPEEEVASLTMVEESR